MTEKMDVLEIVLPVLVMIILGMLCRKWKLLDQNGVNNIKTLVTNIMLPVAIFHALATAKYSGKIGTLVLIMFIMLLISFGVGFLLKRFMEEPYKKYLPFRRRRSCLPVPSEIFRYRRSKLPLCF